MKTRTGRLDAAPFRSVCRIVLLPRFHLHQRFARHRLVGWTRAAWTGAAPSLAAGRICLYLLHPVRAGFDLHEIGR